MQVVRVRGGRHVRVAQRRGVARAQPARQRQVAARRARPARRPAERLPHNTRVTLHAPRSALHTHIASSPRRLSLLSLYYLSNRRM